jgi:hypothetical protein
MDGETGGKPDHRACGVDWVRGERSDYDGDGPPTCMRCGKPTAFVVDFRKGEPPPRLGFPPVFYLCIGCDAEIDNAYGRARHPRGQPSMSAPPSEIVKCALCGADVPEIALSEGAATIDTACPTARGGGFVMVHAWGTSQHLYPFCSECFAKWDPRRFIELQIDALRAVTSAPRGVPIESERDPRRWSAPAFIETFIETEPTISIALPAPRRRTVRMLVAGRAACLDGGEPAALNGLPGDWPAGHVWAYPADFDVVCADGGSFRNAPGCGARHAETRMPLLLLLAQREEKAREEKACPECRVIHWNGSHPVGRPVALHHRGAKLDTKTTSAAWVLGGRAVVQVDEIDGGCDLDRIAPRFEVMAEQTS